MASAGRSPPTARSGRRSPKSGDVWTRPLWPLHFKPLPDELLSSWIVRLAHAHGLKVQTFSRLLAGSGYHLWNRDIDRRAPAWLIDALCGNTAASPDMARQTTLQTYEGEIYAAFRESYVLPWILPLKIKRFTRIGHGLQFCPRCLAEDVEPYFRKRWRVAFYTWCSVHKMMLHDRCPRCGSPVDFLRRELGRPKVTDGGALTKCHECAFDLRKAPARAPTFFEDSARWEFERAISWMEGPQVLTKFDRIGYFDVLHHLCWAMLGTYRSTWLMEFACKALSTRYTMPKHRPRVLELRPIHERHHLTQLGFWLMANPNARLMAAWLEGAVTYSALLRDFADPPGWYNEIVEKFADWRSRPKRHLQPHGSDGRFLPLKRRLHD